jgi:hypothetical protein
MLQQATTLRPFMQEPITLADITRRASKNKVTRVIRAVATQRNDMIDVISPPLRSEWLLTVIAFAMLSFQHALNILYRILTSDLQLAGASSIRVLSFVKATTRRGIIATLILAGLFGVFMLPLRYALQLRIFIACKPLLPTLWVGWLARLLSTLAVRLFSNLSITRPAMVREFVTSGLKVSKELRSRGVQVVALATSLLPINISFTGCSPFAKTVFTTGLQSIGALIVLIEELKRSGVWLFAVNTLLLYTVIHDRDSLSLSSRLGGVSRTRRGILLSLLYHKLAYKANLGG